MTGTIAAFVIWSIMGLMFIGLGIYNIHADTQRPFGFWANARPFEVTDVKAYNKALGKLWIVFGAAFMVLGLPLLGGQNSAGIILSILGCMVLSIAAMVVYVVVIEPRYRKK
jgi:hypothetical protein